MTGRLALLALLLAGCGSRTSLSTRDGAPFVDDDPYLKLDAGRSPLPPADGRGGGPLAADVGVAADVARSSTAAEGVLRDIAKLLWQAEPDPRHLALARSGAIRSATDLDQIVREMLKDPRSEVGVGGFYRWWLHLEDLRTTRKDPQLFPIFPKVVDALIEDVVRFGVEVTLQRDGRFSTLMTASRPYDDMAVSALVGDRGDDPRRSGLLGRPGLLALHALPERPSPVARGLFVRQDLLCEELPDHPPGVDRRVPPQPPGVTNRQQYAALMTSPACLACHSLMDQIGYGFESFDAVGAFRFVDHGLMIDTSGRIVGSSSGDLTFTGLPELGKILAGHGGAQDCIVARWFQYLRGMPPQAGDRLVLRGQAAFKGSGGDMREAIVGILGGIPF